MKITCPRRLNELGPWEYKEGLDKWTRRGCSFCGSISPDDLFKSIVDGEEIVPTDKSYKIYVGRRKFYFQHLNAEEKTKFVDLYNNKAIKFGYPGHFYVLPFFMKYT